MQNPANKIPKINRTDSNNICGYFGELGAASDHWLIQQVAFSFYYINHHCWLRVRSVIKSYHGYKSRWNDEQGLGLTTINLSLFSLCLYLQDIDN